MSNPSDEDVRLELEKYGIDAESPAVEISPAQEATKVELTAVEQEAAAMGWKPDGVKTADEWLRATPLYEEIKKRGKDIKRLEQTVDEMKQFYEKQRELGYQQALKDLKEQKLQAVRAGDVEAVERADAQIEAIRAPEQPTKVILPKEVVEEFQNKHGFWVHDPSDEYAEMREYFHKRDQALTALRLDPIKHAEILDKDIVRKFPQVFAPKEEPVASVSELVDSDASPIRATPKGSKLPSFESLTALQKQCARHFEKVGLMSRDAYIKNLRELGEI